MLNPLKNIARAGKNARAVTDLKDTVAELETRLTMIVSHATGGHTSDWRRSVNDVCVDISRHSNRVYAGGIESAEENPLTGMSKAERDVLDNLSDEVGVRFTSVSIFTGLKRKDVETIVRMFAIKGLVHLTWLCDDEGGLGGRGYCLTTAGAKAQARLRKEAAQSPPWAVNESAGITTLSQCPALATAIGVSDSAVSA